MRLIPTLQPCPMCHGRCTNTRGSLCPMCNGVGEIPNPAHVRAEVDRKSEVVRERPARR